jgi:antitoxin ParD1/3/4
MNVSLTPELEKMLAAKVASGMYNSVSEVVREALRLLNDHDELKRLKFEDLKREAQKGLDDIEAGRVAPADDVFVELTERLLAKTSSEACQG